MENLFKDFDAGIRFDLKGSFNNRTRLTEGQTIYGGPGRDIMVSLKDNDFRTHMKKITFVESLNHNFPPLHLVIEKDGKKLVLEIKMAPPKLATAILDRK